MTEEHHHHEVADLQEKVSQIAVDVAIIMAAVSGENGLPRRVRSLETWRSRIGGQVVIIVGGVGVAVTIAGAIIGAVIARL